MEVKELFEKGIEGVVSYNEIEDSYQLEGKVMAFGLYPIWQDFEGQRVKVTIEVIKE